MDLYVATRSDNPSVLKVGRSDHPDRRCASLQASHCFEVNVLAVWPRAGEYETAVHRALESLREPGPGREWFRASPAEVYAAISLVMHRAGRPHRQVEHPRDEVDELAREMVRHLRPVDRPSQASLRDDIDDLARELCGDLWRCVVGRLGLTTQRSKRVTDRRNVYFYVATFPGSPSPRYVMIGRPPRSSSRALDLEVSEG